MSSALRSAVRVVAFDLDGTILEPGKIISSEVIQAVRLLRDCGVRSVIASGRPVDFQLELLQRYGLGADSGCFQALVCDERELYVRDVSTAVAGFWPDEEWNGRLRRRWTRLAGPARHWLERGRDEADRRGWAGRVELRLDEDVERRGLVNAWFEDAGMAAEICDWLTERLAVVEGLTCNRNVRLVQIYDETAGKGNVLARLAKQWGVHPSQVLAIGDSTNDEQMLDGRFGFAAATVANADDKIKSVVRRRGGYVAAGEMGAGVAEALLALV